MKFNNSEPVNFLVIVKCMTYNQHSFIEDAMNGFCMQKTDFPYVCVVMDDCSTDGEQDVIRKYVQERFLPITDEETDDYVLHYCNHKTNKNCYFAVYYLKYNHYWTDKNRKNRYLTKLQDYCKYIAICEGDDYWIDENKLQTQVDFLEKHPEYVLCAHNSITKNENTGNMSCFNNWLEKDTYNYADIIRNNWFLPTQSLLYRKETYNNNITDKSFFNGDYYTQLCLTRKGGLVYYSNKCMGVYRQGVGISSHITAYDNNLKVIELLEYMSSISDNEYKEIFDKKIRQIEHQNQVYKMNQKSANSIWYMFRYQILEVCIRLLRFKNPSLEIKPNLTFNPEKQKIFVALTHPRYLAGWFKTKIKSLFN